MFKSKEVIVTEKTTDQSVLSHIQSLVSEEERLYKKGVPSG